MVSRAANTRSLSAYEKILLFHPLHVEKESGVRAVKAAKRNQGISGGLGQKCEKKLQEKC